MRKGNGLAKEKLNGNADETEATNDPRENISMESP